VIDPEIEQLRWGQILPGHSYNVPLQPVTEVEVAITAFGLVELVDWAEDDVELVDRDIDELIELVDRDEDKLVVTGVDGQEYVPTIPVLCIQQRYSSVLSQSNANHAAQVVATLGQSSSEQSYTFPAQVGKDEVCLLTRLSPGMRNSSSKDHSARTV